MFLKKWPKFLTYKTKTMSNVFENVPKIPHPLNNTMLNVFENVAKFLICTLRKQAKFILTRSTCHTKNIEETKQ